MTGRARLDLALEARGLMPSRARARDAVLRRTVRVNGMVATKPSMLVSDADAILVDDPAAGYVSRAALKLIAGLDAAGLDVRGKTCLDIGASTGGFTQVLLERGAALVYAVDVGHGQLHQSLLADARVVNLEGLDARDVGTERIPDPIDLLVSDVSFVSLRKVLDPPIRLCAEGAHAVALVKPQFEVGREHVGKGGIVTDGDAISRSVADVISFFADRGWSKVTAVPSPIAGGDGNREFVVVLVRS